jgi:hypothetical protein
MRRPFNCLSIAAFGGRKTSFCSTPCIYLVCFFLYSPSRARRVIWDFCNRRILKQFSSCNSLFKSRIVLVANIFCHVSLSDSVSS